MSAPDEQKPRISRTHWTPNIRQKACECLFAITRDISALRAAIRSGDFTLVPIRDDQGKLRHPAVETFELFFADPLPNRNDRKRAKNLDMKKLYALLRKWAPNWFNGRNKQCREIHAHPEGLTKKEQQELCTLLSTPDKPRGKVHYWRSIDDALDRHPQRTRVQELVIKSRLSLPVLKRQLLHCGGDLHWGVLDIRDPMSKDTDKARVVCAAQWRAAKHWLWVGDEQLAQPIDVKVPPEVKSLRYVFWKEPWPVFSLFTFEYDAYKLSTARGHRDLAARGFYSLEFCYPPEVGRPAGQSKDAHEIQWYVIANKQVGVVGTPEPAYHGSTSTLAGKQLAAARKADKKDPERHAEDFPHWCVSCSTTSPVQSNAC